MIEKHLAVAALVATLCGGCPGGDAEQSPDAGGTDVAEEGDADTDATAAPMDLVSHQEWATVGEAEDPFAEHRPDAVDCPEEARKIETLDNDLTYAVDTTNCNYLAVAQPTLEAVDSGDTVRIRVWHFSLTAFQEGMQTAHVAVVLDEEVLWETEVEIPSDGGLLEDDWVSDREIPAGSRAVFHLHNHGDNQWNFIELSVQ